FPDIADAPALLSGNKVTLVLIEAVDGTSIDMSLTISAKGSRRQSRQAIALMSGSLIRVTDEANPDGNDRAGRGGAGLAPQTVGPPTMSVAPSPAPNGFGSPSFAGYTANAITAIGGGLTSVGNPATTPTAYFRVSSLDDRGNIVTGFPS